MKTAASLMTCLAVAAALVTVPSGDAWAAGKSGECCFRRVVKYEGWTLPALGTPIQSGTYKPSLEFPDGVTFTKFTGVPDASLELSRFVCWEDELVLAPGIWRVAPITRIEIGGRAVAYRATLTCVDCGIITFAVWLDDGGDGRFRAFQWNMTGPEFAAWLRAKVAASRQPG